jgi:hypothetical protein
LAGRVLERRGRPNSKIVGETDYFAAVFYAIVTERVDEPTIGQPLDHQWISRERIGRGVGRQAKIGQIALRHGSRSVATLEGIQDAQAAVLCLDA